MNQVQGRMNSNLLKLFHLVSRRFSPVKKNPVRALRREAYDRLYQGSLREWLLYHQKEIVFEQMTWRGARIWKNPMDIWVYQEIIHEVQPDVIVEIGSRYGGSTKFFADMLELCGKGAVISIDPERSEYTLEHPRVVVLTGKSSDPSILSEVERICRGKAVIVIQDGDHSKRQALEDLENYTPFVSVGSYFIMEDGIVDLFHEGDGIGFEEEGPLAATEEFLSRHTNFVVDEKRERYLLTYNPRGFLKRIN
jgi:cephalosporin hydroxylase